MLGQYSNNNKSTPPQYVSSLTSSISNNKNKEALVDPVSIISIVSPFLKSFIERVFPDKEKQDAAQIELQKVLNDAQAAIAAADAQKMESQSKVVVAEAQGSSWLQRNWRPLTMLACLGMLVNFYFLAPLLNAFGLHILVPPVNDMVWTVVSIGLGGYIGKDMVGTYAQAKFDENKFYKKLHESGMVLTQKQVDVLNAGIDEGTK